MKEPTESYEWFNWGLCCLNENGEILHLCVYENEPTEDDKKNLREELETDEEFSSMRNLKYGMVVIRPDQIGSLLEQMGFKQVA